MAHILLLQIDTVTINGTNEGSVKTEKFYSEMENQSEGSSYGFTELKLRLYYSFNTLTLLKQVMKSFQYFVLVYIC